jgi:hypothetical protein
MQRLERAKELDMEAGSKEQQTFDKWLEVLPDTPDREQLAAVVAALTAGDVDAAIGALHSKQVQSPDHRLERVPGRFKGKLVVDSEFFDPLSEAELGEFWQR